MGRAGKGDPVGEGSIPTHEAAAGEDNTPQKGDSGEKEAQTDPLAAQRGEGRTGKGRDSRHFTRPVQVAGEPCVGRQPGEKGDGKQGELQREQPQHPKDHRCKGESQQPVQGFAGDITAGRGPFHRQKGIADLQGAVGKLAVQKDHGKPPEKVKACPEERTHSGAGETSGI